MPCIRPCFLIGPIGALDFLQGPLWGPLVLGGPWNLSRVSSPDYGPDQKSWICLSATHALIVVDYSRIHVFALEL